MIYAQRVSKTVGGGGFGDVVSEQSSSPAVKRVQLLLQKLNVFTSDPDFNPVSTHGRVNMNTTFAIVSAIRKAIAQAPVLSNLLAKIESVPILRNVLTSRTAFDAAWTIAKYAPDAEGGDFGWALRDYVINPIRAAAAEIDIILKPAVDALAPGATPTETPDAAPFVFKPMVVQYVPFVPPPGEYPPGAFAIRDPGRQKYRILKPIV